MIGLGRNSHWTPDECGAGWVHSRGFSWQTLRSFCVRLIDLPLMRAERIARKPSPGWMRRFDSRLLDSLPGNGRLRWPSVHASGNMSVSAGALSRLTMDRCPGAQETPCCADATRRAMTTAHRKVNGTPMSRVGGTQALSRNRREPTATTPVFPAQEGSRCTRSSLS